MDKNVKKALEMLKKKIDAAYFEVSKRVQPGLEDSKTFPWIMERLMNLEQVKLVLALPDTTRTPSMGRLEVSDQFAQKVNLDKRKANEYVRNLYEKGFLFPTSKGPQLPRSMGQWLDTQNNTKFDKELGDEYYALIGIFSDQELGPPREERIAKRIAAGLKGTSGIIPRWRAIKDIPGVLPGEDVRELIKTNEDFAVLHCACRKRYKERDCGVPEELCMVLGRSALYNIDRGAGRRISREEALEIVNNVTAKYPVVHIGTRTTDPKNFRGVLCHCHFDCCEVMRTPMVIGCKYPVTEFYRKSRYRAAVNPENCIKCRICIDTRCQFDALEMKLYPEFGEERISVNQEKCMGCGCCVETCPGEAHYMQVVEPAESYAPAVAMELDI